MKKEEMWPHAEKERQSIETKPQMTQMLNLADQEWIIMMNGQIGNLNIDIESLKMNQFEILEVKNIISE